MWRKDKYYVLHGMTLNWWFTIEVSEIISRHYLLQQELPGLFICLTNKVFLLKAKHLS